MREVKFADVLKQYKIYHFVDDNTEYRQVTISRHTGVSYRGTKFGRDIGRKRQFVIDLEEYPNTFIFTRQGVQNGSYGMVPQDVHNCVVTENMPMFTVQPTLNPVYFEFYLQTKHFQDQLQALNAAGSAQKSIHEDTLLQLDILLPDIDVQKAIAEEIESVKNKQKKVLVELQTQSALITKLRSSILGDAVSGRLVPQDPNDESASILLERIKAEKERLIKEGELKREKPLSPITVDEIPYELPDGWVWYRLGELLKLQNGYAFKSQYFTDVGVRLARNINIGHGDLNWSDTACYPLDQFEEYPSFALEENDILISLDRPIISTGLKIAKVKKSDLPSLLLQRVGRIEFKRLAIDAQYLYLWFLSSLFMNEIAPGRSNGVPHISTKDIEFLFFPFPPLAEQHCIVSKVEELMATCDALEAEVAKSRMETDRLMQTILKEAFENKKTEVACE